MLELLQNGRGQILTLFFRDPEKEYYLREVAKNLDKKAGAIQAHLNSLKAEGILIDERKGNLRLFRLNKNYPLYDEIKSIISKTVGIEYLIKDIINSIGGVEYSFIFGSIAKNRENSMSDIDLMIIGNVDEDDLISRIDKAEVSLNRVINYHLYSKDEFVNKLVEKNDFIAKVFNEPKILLKGDLNDLTRIN